MPPWTTYTDPGMEYAIWTIYWSGAVPFVGPFIMYPVGMGVYWWITVVSMWTFFEMLFGVGDYWQWLIGPCRRAIVGWLIWNIAARAFPLALLLGPGQLLFWLLGLWANLDYYDYWWTDEDGPLPPIPPEVFWNFDFND